MKSTDSNNQKDSCYLKTLTYYEYVEQLQKLQSMVVNYTFKGENTSNYRIDDAILALKHQASAKELMNTDEFRNGNASLKRLSKELGISYSGKKAEDRVQTLIDKYVSRDDCHTFRNIFLDNGNANSELDNVVLTKDGIVILEVKSVKEDVLISREGRLYVGSDCSYEQTSLADKMERKRQLLNEQLKLALKQKGYSIDLNIKSYVVFNVATNNRINIDNRSREHWCRSTAVPHIINDLHTNSPYTQNEVQILDSILKAFATNQEPFITQVDLDVIKNDIEAYFKMLDRAKDQPEEVTLSDVKDAFLVFTDRFERFAFSRFNWQPFITQGIKKLCTSLNI